MVDMLPVDSFEGWYLSTTYICICGHSLCKPLHASLKYAGNDLLALNILYNMVSVYLSFTLYIF